MNNQVKKDDNSGLNRKTFSALLSMMLIFNASICLFGISQTLSKEPLDNQSEFELKNKSESVLLNSTYTVYRGGDKGEVISNSDSKFSSPVASDYSNPLGGESTLFMPLDEIAIIPSHSALGQGWILNDNISDFSEVKEYNFGFSIEDCISGNFDNDSADEILLGLSNSTVMLIEKINNNYTISWQYSFVDQPNGGSKFAVGDFDDDGINEFARLQAWQSGVHDFFNLSWYDIADDRFMGSMVWNDGDYGSLAFALSPQIEVGDVDGDGIDETVIIGGNHYGWIYDDALSTTPFMELKYFGLSGVYTWGFPTTDLALIDVDGDQRDEILVVSASNNFKIFEDALHFPSYEETTHSIYGFGNIVGANVDSDPMEEIVLFMGGDQRNRAIKVLDDQQSGFAELFFSGDVAYFNKGSLDVGDVDCDGRDEIVIGSFASFTVLDDANSSTPFGTLHSDTEHVSDDWPFVICGDFDGDGAVLNYTGVNWEEKTPPGIMMAMAAPPTYNGISQNLEHSFTSYGDKTSYGSSSENTIETSVGALTGFKVAKLGVEIGTNTIVKDSLAETQTVTNIVAVSSGYASGATDNAVIFQVTTYKNYEYEITTYPANASLVGAFVCIGIPQLPLIYKATASWFNRAYPNATQIGSETFNHTIGQPWTYHPISDVGSIAPTNWHSTTQTVGQGTAQNTISIDISTQMGSGMSRTHSSETTNFGLVMGNGYQQSTGSSETTGFTVTYGNSTKFEGSIGDIDDPDTWSELNYSFGLFVYDVNRTNGIRYRVINYWVDGAKEFTLPPIQAISENVAPFSVWMATIALPIVSFIARLRKPRR